MKSNHVGGWDDKSSPGSWQINGLMISHGKLNQTPPDHVHVPPETIHKALMFGLIKGNQWVFISPDHEAGYFWGGYVRGGVWLTSHNENNFHLWNLYVEP